MIFRLNFDERARIGYLIIKANLRFHAFAGVGEISRLLSNLPRDEGRQINFFIAQDFFQ